MSSLVHSGKSSSYKASRMKTGNTDYEYFKQMIEQLIYLKRKHLPGIPLK